MKLALVISSLAGGGAEHVMTTLANAWVVNGMSVTLISLSNVETDIYPLDPRVKRVGLGLMQPSAHVGQALVANWKRIRVLREVLLAVRPQVALSFMTTTNILTLLASLRTRIPVILSERISLADHLPRRGWQIFYRVVYRRAAAVVTQTERGAKWQMHRLGVPVDVIPNPVHLAGFEHKASAVETILAAARGSGAVLAVGRLTKQKGFDLLLTAFGRVASLHPDWSLIILGEGPERAALEQQARELNIGDRVLMPGFVIGTQAIMRQVDVFALSSRFEGMPNALMEAMAIGLPCVSFDCRTGPAELIDHETNGLLVSAEDVSALAAALTRLMGNDVLRKEMGAAATISMQRYSLDTILTLWRSIFERVRNKRFTA